MPKFIQESFIPAPVERVFALYEKPDFLQRLIPPWEKVEILKRASTLEVGQQVVLLVTLGFVSFRWVVEHVEYEKNKLFTDKQIQGPFKSWYHRHLFQPTEGGTLLRDEIEYTLPGGVISNLVASFLIRPRLQKMFAYRHEVTRKAFEDSREI
jgi:ligand-binding SRPBCC domain-containing protein